MSLQDCSFAIRDADAVDDRGDPFIEYVPVQALISGDEVRRTELSYCPMCIYHYIVDRRISTREIVQPPTHSSEEVTAFLETARRTWGSSEAYKALKTTLESNNPACVVNKIVAFSLSNISRLPPERDMYLRSANQHALLLTLRDIFETPFHRVQCFAQDPAYRSADISALHNFGIEFVDDPKGFLEVDDSSAVISIASNIASKRVVCDIARPSLIIWDKKQELENNME